MGWIPFEACPSMSLVEVENLSWYPDSIKRDLSGDNISVEGISTC